MSSKRDLSIFLLIVCGYLFVVTNCEVCENISPTWMSTISVLCKNVSGSFPVFPKPTSTIKCLDCNIPVVDEGTVKNFVGDTFNLSNSHVQNISLTAFKRLGSNLHRFLFKNNDISYIAPGVFIKFPVLDEINLSKNNISSLPNGTFKNTSVSLLDLSYNHLSNITSMFDEFKVTRLNLSYNEITVLDQNAFDNTTFWTGRQWRASRQQLDLSNNFIKKIYPGTFKSPSSDNFLGNLFLENNQLTAIENNTFGQLKYLIILSLEGNYISQLYTDSFKGLSSLTTLTLRNNQIEIIPPSMFSDLQELQFLDLALNKLSAFTMNTFSGLSHLTKLNVSHNNLRVLDDTHIFPLGKLVNLDISDTKLKDLNLPAILEHHYKLRVLVINDNFWTCKDLVLMYKRMNERIGGFDYPTHHYDVPNLHGIACSRNQLDSYDDITFDDFLNVISQDRVFEDLFDSRINNDYDGFIQLDAITGTIKHINGIFYMLAVITFLTMILFIQCIVRCACLYLNRRHTVPSKFSFMYAPNQDNVQLI